MDIIKQRKRTHTISYNANAKCHRELSAFEGFLEARAKTDNVINRLLLTADMPCLYM